MVRKVLVVLTSHDNLGKTGKKTGWYLPEFAHPYDKFVGAGFEIDVASPKGGTAPLDPASVELFKDDTSSSEFLAKHSSVWADTMPLQTLAGNNATAQATAAKYDALFYPGGHGPMFDLATDVDNGRLATAFWAAGKVVSAVCHGPAALLLAKTSADGSVPLVAGKTISAFTDSEERDVELDSLVPFLLEKKLRETGARLETGPNWAEKVSVEGKLITGQNPASAKAVGAAIVEALQ